MQHFIQRTILSTAVAVSLVVLDASAAMAQLVQSEVDAEPAPAEVTQLVTSSTEVRRAVIGLVVVAVITGALGVVYWYKTGQQARERHDRRYGGRHRPDGTQQHVHEGQDRTGRQALQPRTWSTPHPVAPPTADVTPVPPSTRIPVRQPVGAERGPVVWRED